MVDVTEISAVVAATGVVIGVVYYIVDMRHQSKVRQTDLVLRLYDKFGSTEFQKAYQMILALEYEDYADYVKRYRPNTEIRAAVHTVNGFFEGIGVLVKRKLVSIGLVDDLLGGSILAVWEKRKPITEGSRQRASRPSLWEWFEYLYNEIKKHEEKHQ